MSFFSRLKTVARAEINHGYMESCRWSLDDSCIGHIDGISVCDLAISKKVDFLPLVEEAMELIKSRDARRHRRVCRHLKYIVNIPLASIGVYVRQLQYCGVDAEKLFYRRHYDNVAMMACIIIHEATHGLLEEKFILYTADKRERIEGLCHKEEYRFATRLKPGWIKYVGPFRPELWKATWEGTRWDRLKALVERWGQDFPEGGQE